MQVVQPIFAAYGRTYQDAGQAQAAWQNGTHDWRIYKGPYLSVRDTQRLRDMGFSHVMLHWHADGKLQSLQLPLGGLRKADPLAELGI